MVIEAALLCLTQAVYFEARSETIAGQRAVAEVVMNRVASSVFPNDVCSVVQQDLGPEARDCQFSFWCDGKPETMDDDAALQDSRQIAIDVIHMGYYMVGRAEFYHTVGVTPSWTKNLNRVNQIGVHIFYEWKED